MNRYSVKPTVPFNNFYMKHQQHKDFILNVVINTTGRREEDKNSVLEAICKHDGIEQKIRSDYKGN